MGLGDKIKNAAEEVVGKAKEEWGDLTDNEKLEAEGKAQQAAANAKQAGEEVKDAASNAAEGVKDAAAEVKEGASDAAQDVKDAWDDTKR